MIVRPIRSAIRQPIVSALASGAGGVAVGKIWLRSDALWADGTPIWI